MNVVAVIPSRGRPDRACEALAAAQENARLVSTDIVLVIDTDDPEHRAYQWDIPRRFDFAAPITVVSLDPYDSGSLVRATNTVSMRIARENPSAIIGNLGDDHLIRTPGWDKLVTEALRTPGIAYGRDGIHDERLPTAPFISARIVNALGWYALPTARHMYIDNVWLDLANELGVRRYLPELYIEHVHPGVGKAETDAGYDRANASTEHDRAAYEEWRAKFKGLDVAAVRRAL